MEKRKISILFLFLFSIVFVSAFDSSSPFGYFNEALTDFNSYVAFAQSNTKDMVISDLNNDGKKEIILISNNEIKTFLYDGLSLIEKSSYTTSCVTDSYSNIIAYDINGDGNKEIAFTCDNKVRIYNYTNEELKLQKSYTAQGLTIFNQSIITCADKEKCYVVSTRYPQETYTTQGRIWITTFNTSFIGKENLIWSVAIASYRIVLPNIKNIPCSDFKGNGVIQCAFSTYMRTNTDSYNIDLWIFNASAINTTFGYDKKTTLTDATSALPVTSNYRDILSSPLISNIRTNSGDEIIIAYNKDVDEFVLKIFDAFGNVIDTAPAIQEADGNIISNVVYGTFHNNNQPDKSICAMGYTKTGTCQGKTAPCINLVCYAQQPNTFLGIQTDEFYYSGVTYNITDYSKFGVIRSTNQRIQIDNEKYWFSKAYPTDKDEILTPYGVMALNYYNETEPLTLNLLFENPVNDASLNNIQDLIGDGHPEYIALSENYLYVFDDKFTNSPAYIYIPSVNPCVTAIWKVNTSVLVSFRVKDIDNDNVCANAYLYYDTIYQQNISDVCLSANSQFNFLFKANETGSSYILRLKGYDVVNPSNIDYYDITFSVGLNGVSYGECVSTFSDVGVSMPISVNETTISQNPATTNVLSDAMKSINDYLGFGTIVLWLIIMVAVSGAFAYGYREMAGYHSNPSIMAGIFFTIMFIMLIIGTILGFLPVGILITLIICFILVIALFIWKYVTSETH